MKVREVKRTEYGEEITMNCVPKNGAYPEDGSDEDNTFAKFSPTGELKLTVANPALFGKINPGEAYYLDFTPAEA